MQQPKAAAAAAAKKGNARDELELEIDFGDAGRKTNPKGDDLFVCVCVGLILLCLLIWLSLNCSSLFVDSVVFELFFFVCFWLSFFLSL